MRPPFKVSNHNARQARWSFFEMFGEDTRAMGRLTTCSEGRILRNASYK